LNEVRALLSVDLREETALASVFDPSRGSQRNSKGLSVVNLVVEFTPPEVSANIFTMKRHFICSALNLVQSHRAKTPLDYSVFSVAGGALSLGPSGLQEGLNTREVGEPRKQL